MAEIQITKGWSLGGKHPDLKPKYYVSATGNDNNDGLTPSTPWQTLSKVSGYSFNPGDIIGFKRGDTFYGSLTISRSGNSSLPIIYTAYGVGATPIITGFSSITAWTNLGNNIWESTNTVSTLSTCNMVTIGGTATPMARFPKVDAANGGYLYIDSKPNTNQITSSGLTGTPDYTGSEVVIRRSSYEISRYSVTAQSGSTITYSSTFGQVGRAFILQNSLACCTQQNDWYYNPTTKKLSIYSTSQPTNINIASAGNNLVTITANYISISNLKFTGANECGIYANAYGVYHNISVTNCAFDNIGVCGILMWASYLTIYNNIITNCFSSAISTDQGTYIDVKHNYIENIGTYFGMKMDTVGTLTTPVQSCVQTATTNYYTFEYNTIKNVGFNGINYCAGYASISYNYIDTFCTLLEDGAGIYTFTGDTIPDRQSQIISHNIILNGIGNQYGVTTRFPASGIYLDARSANVEIAYNSIANSFMFGIFINETHNNINTHHNTVYNSSQFQLYNTFFSSTGHPTGNIIKNNILVAKNSGIGAEDYQKTLGIYLVGDMTTHSILKANWNIDYNYYARPIANTKIIYLVDANANLNNRTLAEWQTVTGFDSHSYGAPQAITSVNDIYFYYNETTLPKTVTLASNMIDVTGVTYAAGTITLAPFTSKVLMIDN